MKTFKLCKTSVFAVALFASAGAFAATAMSPADYSTHKTRISTEHKADKAACDQMSGNAKDVCEKKADGKEKVARAELEYSRSGKASDARKLAEARADADYSVAKEMCDDKAGNAEDVCEKEAKAAHTKALADAKVAEKTSDARKNVGEARKNANADKREADYKVATEKCDSLAGDAKTSCMSAAKAEFGKK